MKNRKMIKGEMVCVIALLIIGLLAFAASLQLFLKNPGVANQGTFPLLASSIMVLSSLVMMGEMRYLSPSFDKEDKGNKVKETVAHLLPDKMTAVIILVVVYAILLPKLGFAIATTGFLFLMMLCLKAGKWYRCALISVGLVIAIMIIFQYIFHVVLP